MSFHTVYNIQVYPLNPYSLDLYSIKSDVVNLQREVSNTFFAQATWQILSSMRSVHQTMCSQAQIWRQSHRDAKGSHTWEYSKATKNHCRHCRLVTLHHMELKPCQRCCCRTSGPLGEGEWSFALLKPEFCASSQIFKWCITFPNHVVCILLLSALLVSVPTLGLDANVQGKAMLRCLTLCTISAKCLAFGTHWEVDHMAFVQLHFAAWICLDAKEYTVYIYIYIEREREREREREIHLVHCVACL